MVNIARSTHFYMGSTYLQERSQTSGWLPASSWDCPCVWSAPQSLSVRCSSPWSAVGLLLWGRWGLLSVWSLPNWLQWEWEGDSASVSHQPVDASGVVREVLFSIALHVFLLILQWPRAILKTPNSNKCQLLKSINELFYIMRVCCQKINKQMQIYWKD